MNIGTRLLLSAALAVGSTVGAAALGQTVVRDTQAEVGAAAPQSIATEGAGNGVARRMQRRTSAKTAWPGCARSSQPPRLPVRSPGMPPNV